MNNEKKTLTEAVPAARDLRRVPGFDPMAFTREVTAKDGKKYLTLDLKHKKTWFRLACPNGSMLLSALQVNSTTAMFEARVLADKDDRNPLASYIAVRTADKASTSGLHIRAAQDEALNEALDNAGFGLQLGDVIRVSSGSGFGSVAPLSDVEAMRKTAAAANPDNASGVAPKVEPKAEGSPPPKIDFGKKVEQGTAPGQQKGGNSVPDNQKAAVQVTDANKRPAPIGPPPHGPNFTPPTQKRIDVPAQKNEGQPAPVSSENQETIPQVAGPDAQSRAAVLDIGTGLPVGQDKETDGGQTQSGQDAKTETEPQAKPSAVTEPAEATPTEAAENAPVTYTADMTVEEICERMTLEQAKAYTVAQGTCKGWTLEQVATDRFSSLKWFTTVCPFADNIMKAAAQLVLRDVELKKAG